MQNYSDNEGRAISVSALIALVLLFAGIFVLVVTFSARAEPGDKHDVYQQHPAKVLPRAAGNRFQSPSSAVAGRRPSQCPPVRWCGCYLAHYLGLHDRSLWAARSWLKLGTPIARPVPGAVAVYARGRGGHVGLVRAVRGKNIVLLSGNDNGAVRERERSTAGIIGYRKI